MSSETQPAADPAALAAFRQQAGAILAQERGLTPAGRVKLAGLARQLGIPEGGIDAAIRSLGESGGPAPPPDPQIEKFRRRLQKDLAGKSRTIIGPTIESQIVAAAMQKYGLADAVARQIVGEVAAELGLRKISANEAVRNLSAQIDQATGEATWLAKEAWDRLRVAGGKWGIPLDEIDQLIDEKLAANRADKSRRQFVARAVLVGAGGSLAVVAVVLVLVVFFWPTADPATIVSPGVDPATTPLLTTEPARPKAQPAWWDVDLSVAIASGQSKFTALAPIYDLLASDAPAERTLGYQKLVELVANPSPPANLRPALAGILSGSFGLEPDDGAARGLLDALLALIPAVDAPLPKSRGQYDVAYWAGATAVEMFHRKGLSEERRKLIETAVQRAVRGVTAANLADEWPARDVAMRHGVTERLFEQLTAAAAREPAGVAVLFGYVTDLAADLSDEQFERLEASFLAAALPAAGKNWKQYQEAIARAVGSTDPLNALKILDAYQRASDPELRQALAELLVIRSKAQPKSWEPADVVSAVRKGLGLSGNAASLSAQDRWQLLKLRVDAALARPLPAKTDQTQWLAQTVELAHLTTLALALAQGDAGYAVFDAQIEAPPQLVKSGSPASGETPAPALPTPRRTLAPLAARDKQQLEQLADQATNFARLKLVQRESMIRGLALMADRADDITPQQANHIAAYILAPKNDDENGTVRGALVNLRRWKHLRLAIADAWPASRLTDDQRRAIVGAVLRSDAAADSIAPADVPRAIVQSVLADLEDEAATASPVAALSSSSVVFNDAAELLTETYRTRGRLLSAPSGEVAAADSPAKALYLAIDPVAKSLRPVATAEDQHYLARLPHEATALGFVGRDDLRRTVAIDRVFVQLSARQAARLRPTQAAAAEKIATELVAADLTAPSVLAQLHSHERAALQIWMLYAPQT